ncbi:MAG: hypothetical protein GY822_13020 [Deltaproteobacteria bacterium]|nr:hypothetical protein [Deltaproteobacteria bacterium]
MALGGFQKSFFGSRFLPIVSQVDDGKARWTDMDIKSIVPFITIASVERWNLQDPTDDQAQALQITQRALKLDDYDDQNAVREAVNTYYQSGVVKEELAQLILRVLDQPEAEPEPVMGADALQSKIRKKAKGVRKGGQSGLFPKEMFDDAQAKTAARMQKITGNESGVNVKLAPTGDEPKPEGSIDLGTLAYQLSGRRRM